MGAGDYFNISIDVKESHIYDLESEDRREYLTEKIKQAVGISKSTTKEDYKKELKDLLLTDFKDLTSNQKQIYFYLAGEKKTKFLVDDTFKRLKQELEDDFKERIEEDIETKFIKEPQREYSVLRDLKGEEIKLFGFQRDKKIEIRTEERLIKGKMIVRYRAKNGRFASFTAE